MDSSKNDDRKLKKLSLKVRYLREELNDVESEFDRRDREFNIVVNEFMSRAGLAHAMNQRPAPPEVDETINEDDKSVSPWQRKLFRKISSKTHPDALLHDEMSDRQREERVLMFRDAHEALQRGIGGKLIEIAADLNIEINDVPAEEHIRSMDQLANELESKAKSLKSTAAWIWGDGQRREILAYAMRLNGWSGAPESLIDDVIEWMDESRHNSSGRA